MRRRKIMILAVAAVLAGAGCVVREVQRGPALDARARWALLPIRNQTETPRAGERVQSILATLLRSRGLARLEPERSAGAERDGLPELDERRELDRATAWAKAQGFTYGVTGSVEEWRYRNGFEGEPAVGVSLEVLELASGRVVWSASGARAGWGRDTLAGTTQALLKSLLGELALR